MNGMALKGTFKAAEADKGFGFIDCPDAKEYFGRDVYVNKEFAAGLQTGQQVSFNVKLNRDMMPNVTEVALVDDEWEPSPGDLSETKDAPDVPPSWESSAIAGVHMSGSRRGGTPQATGEFFTAEFKTYNEANGWGFVGSDELRARFGSDVFAHNRELVDVPVKAVGEMIYFELGMTEDGKPQVLNAQAPGAVPVPVAAIPVASEDGAATSDAVPAEAPTPETGAPGAASAASDAPASGSAASDAPHAVSAPDATPTQRLNSTEPWGESADAAVLPDPAPVPKDSRTSANAPEAGSTAAVTAPSATSEAVESVSEPPTKKQKTEESEGNGGAMVVDSKGTEGS